MGAKTAFSSPILCFLYFTLMTPAPLPKSVRVSFYICNSKQTHFKNYD